MTAIAWKAKLIDLVTLATVDTLTGAEIINPQFGSVIDAAGSIHLELRPGTTFINHVLDAVGGPAFKNKPKAYLLLMSIDNGATWPTAAWLKKGSVKISGAEVGVVIDQADIIEGYSASYIDDATYIDIKVGQIMNALPGTIQFNSAKVISASSTLPANWQGLFNHTPGRKAMESLLKMQAITNPLIANFLADAVVNSDSIINTAMNVLGTVAGVYDPSNPANFGAFQHMSFDIRNMQINVGYRGLTSLCLLTDQVTPHDANELIEAAIVDTDTISIDFDLSTYFAQTQVVGGASTHNMPDGGQFTGVAIINKPASGLSMGTYDNLIILAITSGGNGIGGVYYWLGDGMLRPLSQSVDVNGLSVDGTANIMYAASRIGVLFRPCAGPYMAVAWARLGDATLEFTKVWIPAEGVVYAIAGGSNNDAGSNGVWRYTVADGWIHVLANQNMIDASGGDTELYFSTTVAPTIVTKTQYPSLGTPTKIPTGGAHVVGMDFNSAGNVIVRTELGAIGLYQVLAGVMTRVDPTGTLADGFGPLSVARFLTYTGTINGQVVNAFAVTDRGIYWRAASGGAFNPTDGQSGIQEVQATWIDVGQPQYVMGRVFTPLVAVTGRSLYISRDGGEHWSDELTQNVDGLIAWYEAIKKWTGDYPRGDVGAFASSLVGTGGLQDPTDPEGNGSIVTVPSGDPLSLPAQWCVSRRWTDNGRFTCRMVDTTSNAPYNAMKPAEATEVVADDSRGCVDASSACLDFMYRVLSQASQPQTALALTVAVNSQEAKINFAKCGDMVTVHLYSAYENAAATVTTIMADFDNEELYIVSAKSRTSAENALLWDLTLVNNTTYTLLDVSKILSALANGQAKDRRLIRPRLR